MTGAWKDAKRADSTSGVALVLFYIFALVGERYSPQRGSRGLVRPQRALILLDKRQQGAKFGLS